MRIIGVLGALLTLSFLALLTHSVYSDLRIEDSWFACNETRCDYRVTIESDFEQEAKGVLVINSFRSIGRLKAPREDWVQKDLRNFTIPAGGRLQLIGHVISGTESTRLQFGVGLEQVGQSK